MTKLQVDGESCDVHWLQIVWDGDKVKILARIPSVFKYTDLNKCGRFIVRNVAFSLVLGEPKSIKGRGGFVNEIEWEWDNSNDQHA